MGDYARFLYTHFVGNHRDLRAVGITGIRRSKSRAWLIIGSDTGTPVDDKDYQVPFKFTGELIKLTIKLDPPKLSEAEERFLRQDGQRNNKASE